MLWLSKKQMDSFEQYLTKCSQKGASEFTIKCLSSNATTGKQTFYIYPVGVEAETLLIECAGNEIKINYYLPTGFRIVQNDSESIQDNSETVQDDQQSSS